ncbi:MAG: DUF2231 domain-containing protein [Pseudorhodobacter sp.]
MQQRTEKPEPPADDDDGLTPVLDAVALHDTGSAVALIGHPIHAMLVHFPIAFVVGTLGADLLWWFAADVFWLRAGVWMAGLAFLGGIAAAIAGTAELLLVKGIRIRVASWTHATAAMMLISILGANWGLRLTGGEVLPHGLALSALGVVFAGLAGWHGGKLVLDHGVGVMVSPKR